MIEGVVRGYLEDALDVPCRMEVPSGAPERFVVVEKTGSDTENHICRATIAVQSYGPTLLEAARLNERVKAAMDGLSGLDEICRCRLNSDYNYTDTASKRYRYQAVYDITHY